MTEVMKLQALEAKAERALEKAETGWREFAETMREIKSSGVYRQSHATWSGYVRERWGTAFQFTYEAIASLEVSNQIQAVSPTANIPNDVKALYKLKRVAEPEEKARIVEESIAEPGRFRENVYAKVAEYKGEPTVRDVLKPEDLADIPSGEFDRAEEKASLTSKIVPRTTDDPSEVAEAAYRLYGENIERHIRWAGEIADWYAKYRDELVARQRQGIRAVK